MRALLASPLGLLIGLILGSLGGGGSLLSVPALVYGAGLSATAATGASLVVVGGAALVGVVPHLRAGHVRVGAGLAFGLAGVGGSALGTTLNRRVDEDLLLLAFSALVVTAALALRRRSGPARRVEEAPHDATPGATGLALEVEVARRAGLATTARVLLAGTVVGALTGFFGVGGGFVVVPALVLSLGYAMPVAVGTSLVVIAVNATVALALRGGGDVDWLAAAPFLLATAAGTALGARVAGRVDAARLTRGFVWLLFAVAAVTATRSAAALVG